MEKYYLIFKDSNHHLIFIETKDLNELYKLILNKKLIEGSYRIIKGSKVI